MRVGRSVKHRFLWWSWYSTDYFPSGTIKVQNYHQMNSSAGVTNYYSLTDVPLKGVKIQLWNWFKWNSAYTNENGYYESSLAYDGDPGHYIYFSGRNGNNSWDLDRVTLWGVCLWVQKYSLGAQSRDNYDATIASNSDAWDACLTNNAFYEYMTIADKDGLTRPPAHLQVALRVNLSGASSAPMFQNHTNTLTTSVLAGFFTSTFLTAGATAPATVAYIAFLNSLPDILLSAGNIKEYQTKYGFTEKNSLNEYYSTIWHELSHSSNLQRIINEKGYWTASGFWSSMIGTEVGHNVTSLGSSCYGKKGDGNWEQIALCEGWAYYRGWKMPITNFSYYSNFDNSKYPNDYMNMYDELASNGCSIVNLEKCLTTKTFSEYKQLLLNIYSNNAISSKSISTIIDKYYNKTY